MAQPQPSVGCQYVPITGAAIMKRRKCSASASERNRRSASAGRTIRSVQLSVFGTASLPAAWRTPPGDVPSGYGHASNAFAHTSTGQKPESLLLAARVLLTGAPIQRDIRPRVRRTRARVERCCGRARWAPRFLEQTRTRIQAMRADLVRFRRTAQRTDAARGASAAPLGCASTR